MVNRIKIVINNGDIPINNHLEVQSISKISLKKVNKYYKKLI